MLFLIRNLSGWILLLFVVNTQLHDGSHKWQKGLKGGRVLKGIDAHSCIHANKNKWQPNRNKYCKPRSYLYIQNQRRKKRQSYMLNRYNVCSIFSIFDKSNEAKKKNIERESTSTGVPHKGNAPNKGMLQGEKTSTGVVAPGKVLPSMETPPLITSPGCKLEGCIDLSNLESNPKGALKNEIEYRKHLENFKSKIILSLQTIFCSYTKSIDTSDNLRNFVLNILSDFELKFRKYTHLTNVQNMHNHKMKEEYLQSNYNCFLDIVKMIEENLYNILLYKIQSIKLKALDDIKETVLSHRESNADYISYVNHVNKIFEVYEKKLQNLFPANFKFSLYNKMSKNCGVEEQQPSSMSNFVYNFPIEKYEQLIKKNINYVKKLSHDLTKKKKKKLIKEIERSKNYQNILHIIDNQQKQIEILQEQLETNVEGSPGKYSPFHCAVAYRIPDTNLNVSTQYVKGKFNVKMNCIPDDSLHLLGSYGFVKALPFGNLGLSFSMNF
ncbi:peripheral plastid protein 1, putative [Plasmodium knowlesi strain H]|uniref:Peripheral plastid protein 1, putative n=3 Tax=Plasmodium knowlesi TaxID=5850 RepID=A0A5K1UAB2_PLAKH|nr:peripheral plastid protein 1, putative [Plasmodium knowlesi strain H]OTN66801.1 putative Peripheral plastid protein 1 [Plasmodium knowlesi]CAA9990160.1 peripheral plastid protein 1, putative [Plasmodium knowlesi strain H]SBO25853.1 peripheral plastid protein 1, putative [Plasmodium knowlesi strain H]SBO28633.1 peripheral plastid protein 1, putative [Plasmodium knowlesi strain H]VVS79634.1 peripheral plastid protein 1, putative [Plasmodium knowlesi strain H]|eukprot:XP_002260627.1 hypothetical protein, conserved in Plasmodium species [Plasmodium knowlesi strain H]